MAIIKNTEVRIRIVPSGNDLVPIKLAPGFNEVEDSAWIKGRLNCKYELENGLLVELQVSVKDDKDGQSITGKKFNELEANKALEVVAGTFFVPQLEAWRGKSTKDEIRLAISKQIDKVNAERKEG